MKVDRNTLLFFDAACLIAAVGSPTGGSGFLLHLCRRELLRDAISPIVLWEAETNIAAKLPSALTRFHQLVAITPFVVSPTPSPPEIHHYQSVVNHKDAHVIAAAMAPKASYLLTLDQNFLREVQAAQLAAVRLDARCVYQRKLTQSSSSYFWSAGALDRYVVAMVRYSHQ